METLKRFVTRERLLVVLISLLPVVLLYLPFALKLGQFGVIPIKDPGMYNVVRNWDGPNYIVVARTLYDESKIREFPIGELDTSYYTAHLPLFPLLMVLAAPVVGWLYSGIAVSVFFGIALNLLFYEIARKYTKHALWLTLVFTLFPARFLVTRAVIAPETLTVFLTLLSVYFWEKGRVLPASLAGFFAVLAKFQAIFLFPAFALVVAERIFAKKEPFRAKYLWLVLIPLAFGALSLYYWWRVGDFFAFLNAQEDNNLALSIPFSQFNYSNPWSNSGWLEDVALYLVGMIVLTVSLWKEKERSWFYYSAIYTLFLVFLPHRDITRYSMPLAPFFILHFREFFGSRAFRIALIIAMPALYLYALNFMMTNQAVILDWSAYAR